jgi:hypothetical protein
MTTPNKRQLTLGAALALTLAATLWLAASDEADNHSAAQPVAGNSRAPVLAAGTGSSARSSTSTTNAAAQAEAKADAAAPLDWAPVARPAWAQLPADDAQFAAWSPPPPPPAPPFVAPPPPPPAAPQAPPFPYQLIGRLVEGDQAQILLAGPSSTLAVRVGDVVDGQWRVDQINERGLNLTWLPAKLNQTIGFRPNS